MEFYPTLLECISNVNLTEDQQQRLLPDLARLVTVDSAWLEWRDGKLRAMLNRLASTDLDNTLPILADLCDEAGLPDFVVRLLRERTRWVYSLLCEHL